jgi:hypothetical protein
MCPDFILFFRLVISTCLESYLRARATKHPVDQPCMIASINGYVITYINNPACLGSGLVCFISVSGWLCACTFGFDWHVRLATLALDRALLWPVLRLNPSLNVSPSPCPTPPQSRPRRLCNRSPGAAPRDGPMVRVQGHYQESLCAQPPEQADV